MEMGGFFAQGQEPRRGDDQYKEIARLAKEENNKVAAIKLTRQLTGLDLKEAKDFVEQDILGEDPKAPSSSSKGGCYVATAVYGSYDCPQVWILRRFRDYELAQTRRGRAFIRVYYAVSPTLVKWFGDSAWFKNMWRGSLDRLVASCRAKGFADTPYKDKDGYGKLTIW